MLPFSSILVTMSNTFLHLFIAWSFLQTHDAPRIVWPLDTKDERNYPHPQRVQSPAGTGPHNYRAQGESFWLKPDSTCHWLGTRVLRPLCSPAVPSQSSRTQLAIFVAPASNIMPHKYHWGPQFFRVDRWMDGIGWLVCIQNDFFKASLGSFFN